MRCDGVGFAIRGLTVALGIFVWAGATFAQSPVGPAEDPVKVLVGRLDLEKYKATIKSLTQFGDRRQGTNRNRAAVDWIEAQLKLYGCANIERLKYVYDPPAAQSGPQRGRETPTSPVLAGGEIRSGVGGSRYRGITRPTGVNTDPNAQPDVKLRALNSQPTAPGPREEVYCTKVGTTRPDEMYIVGAHMDGPGWNEWRSRARRIHPVQVDIRNPGGSR